MGEVWRAEDRALRRNVALKILSPEHGRKPSRVARFERTNGSFSDVSFSDDDAQPPISYCPAL